jgi:pimeloyl-ACP methyl ester carboxylesterase
MSGHDSTLARVRLHVQRKGAGTPVVLSHGLGDDAGTWDELLPRLADHHDVRSWDLRGHRHSEAPDSAAGYGLGPAIEDLLGILADVGEPAHLVGHSLGGLLSLTIALRRPELVRSLTMISSGPGFRDPQSRDAWNQYVAKAVQRMPVPPEAAALATQADSWVIDHVDELTPPLLVVVGERDARFQAGADFLHRAVRGSTLLRVPDAGHHPQRSHPEQVAAALLTHFGGATCR